MNDVIQSSTVEQAFAGAQRVRVSAVVSFDAFVMPTQGHDRQSRIGQEIADAIEHHAPHLWDSEDGDALIALTEGGTGRAVRVAEVAVGDCDAVTAAEVVCAIEATRSWM